MANETIRIQAIPDPRWESVNDSQPLKGIMTSFPILDGNWIIYLDFLMDQAASGYNIGPTLSSSGVFLVPGLATAKGWR